MDVQIEPMPYRKGATCKIAHWGIFDIPIITVAARDINGLDWAEFNAAPNFVNRARFLTGPMPSQPTVLKHVAQLLSLPRCDWSLFSCVHIYYFFSTCYPVFCIYIGSLDAVIWYVILYHRRSVLQWCNNHHHHHYSACTMSVRSSACYQ